MYNLYLTENFMSTKIKRLSSAIYKHLKFYKSSNAKSPL